MKQTNKQTCVSDVVRFLSVEGPIDWALGPTSGVGGLTIRLSYTSPCLAKNVVVIGPLGPLGDHIPVCRQTYEFSAVKNRQIPM